jgi:hypothetical protein
LRSSSSTLNIQINTIEATYRSFTTEVQEREDEIRQARNRLIQEVDHTLKESAARFKEGRAAMVKSLAQYDTACQKMSQRIGFMTEIAGELVPAVVPVPTSAPSNGNIPAPSFSLRTWPAPTATYKRWEPGQGHSIHRIPIPVMTSVVTSPTGTHYTSPLGTMRPIGEVRGTYG